MANEFLGYYLDTAEGGKAVALYKTTRGEIFVRVENEEGDEARFGRPGRRYRFGRMCFDSYEDFSEWVRTVSGGAIRRLDVVRAVLEELKGRGA
jgi:hypothetical protein